MTATAAALPDGGGVATVALRARGGDVWPFGVGCAGAGCGKVSRVVAVPAAAAAAAATWLAVVLGVHGEV